MLFRPFRSIVSRMRYFWTFIRSSMTNHQVDTYIRNSFPSPITVQILYTKGTNGTTLHQFFRKACEVSGRWKHILIFFSCNRLDDDNANAMIRTLRNVSSAINPQQLQSIHINMSAKEKLVCTPNLEADASFFRTWRIPESCRVSVCGIIPQFGNSRSLAELRITVGKQHVFARNTLSPVVELLANSPCLRVLILGFDGSRAGASLKEIIAPAFKDKKVRLPGLTVFVLHYRDMDNYTRGADQAYHFLYVINSLDAPALRAASFLFHAYEWYVPRRELLVDQIIRFAERSPLLVSLKVELGTHIKEVCDEPSLITFLKRLTQLHHFVFLDNHTRSTGAVVPCSTRAIEQRACALETLHLRDGLYLDIGLILYLSQLLRLDQPGLRSQSKFRRLEIAGLTFLGRRDVERAIGEDRLVWHAETPNCRGRRLEETHLD